MLIDIITTPDGFDQLNMSANQSQALSQIIEQITGDHVYEKKGSRFFFKIYLNPQMSETPIESLELGVRAYNSLKRASYSTIGELADAIASGTEIIDAEGLLKTYLTPDLYEILVR